MPKKSKKTDLILPKTIYLTKAEFRLAKQSKFYWQGFDLLDVNTHVCIIARDGVGLVNYSHWWNSNKKYNRNNIPLKYR